MPNRLASSASPYLKQHQDNPVDWYPWGDEAFELARKLDRPIFLSVGYSSCHWCHVMAHESFEDAEVANLLNAEFVCIKVDREERPDVDEVYMTAVQLMSQRGGWPMSVFMTPDRRPFFTGTYWPKEDREGHPGFLTVVGQLATVWKSRRKDIEESATQISAALEEALTAPAPEADVELNKAFLDIAVQSLAESFDQLNGGFGAAPKFPPHTAIEFLLRYAMLPSPEPDLQEAAISMALFTLRAMVLGGIHDHVGGGFHRYSTDEKWLLPHFEKMLYDNALILGNLAQAAGMAAEIEPTLAQMFARAAQSIIDWLMREMLSEQSVFYSAQDADSEGEEGKFYTWRADEVEALIKHHAPVFMDAFQVTADGNFEDEATGLKTGVNILHLKEDLAGQFEQELEMLRVQRETRVAPGLDDKALVSWNGLTIGALADAGMWPLAQNALVGILAAEKSLGHLPHLISQGSGSGYGYLDDYAYLTQGILKLAVCVSYLEQQGELPQQGIPTEALIGQAVRLCREMITKFYDEENGGFFATSSDHEQLFGRTKPVFDQPTPSANAIAIRCLHQLGDRGRALKSLQSLKGWMARAPQATEALYTAAIALLYEGVDPESEGASAAEAPVIEVPATVASAAPVPTKLSADVIVKISAREIQANASGVGNGIISIAIPEGFHINSNTPPARWLTPTKIQVQGAKAEISYPPSVDEQYTGNIEIVFSVQLPSGESGIEFEMVVSYQACTESECLAPAEKVFTAVVVR